MKYHILLAFGLAFTLPLFAEEAKPATETKPAEEAKAKPTPEAAFKKKDKDSDGFLTKDEFVGKATDAAKTKAEAAFTKKDTNSDGKLSPEEFAAKPANAGKGGKKNK